MPAISSEVKPGLFKAADYVGVLTAGSIAADTHDMFYMTPGADKDVAEFAVANVGSDGIVASAVGLVILEPAFYLAVHYGGDSAFAAGQSIAYK